ncbi:MAG TPA: hypothetical protein PKY59_05010 [Pyrinomonadaceae bacterium]|nr:hypothetical protein [Pyrinomonadaceae bacterium]
MYLDEGSNFKNLINTETNFGAAKAVPAFEKKRVFDKWADWNPSQISHHGEICCEIAREWLTATDFSQLNGDHLSTGPRWLLERFDWGASKFPIYWCEAVRKETLDCGALAAFSQEIFTARNIKCFRVQLVQKFSELSTKQWTESWSEAEKPLAWTENDLIYHEGCAIETSAQNIKVWDASAGWWIDPKPSKGYGSVLAIRVSGDDLPKDKNLIWGENILKPFAWQEIG